MLSNFSLTRPMNGIDEMIKAEMATRQNREKALANQKTEAELPYVAENAMHESQIKKTQALYAPQKAMLDYQQSMVDLEKATWELQMYPQNQNSLNDYRNALTRVNNIRADNPALMGSGPAKDIATFDILDTESGRNTNQYSGSSNLNGNIQPISNISPSRNQHQGNHGGLAHPIDKNISSNPALQNPNYQIQHETNSGLKSPQDIIRERAGKTGAELAREEEFAVQEAKTYANRMTDLSEMAGKAATQNASIESILGAYSKVPDLQKGTLLGQLPPGSQGAIMFEALEKGVVLEELLKQKGVQNEGDRRAIEAKFAGRRLTDENKEELFTLYKINNDREIAKQAFFADKKGQDPYQIEKEWNQILNKSSVFREPQYIKMKQRQLFRNMTPEQRENARLIISQEQEMARKQNQGSGAMK